MDGKKNSRIFVVWGDITAQSVDAVVNAANPTLLGGGGVDGAIHRAAGPELLQECRTLGGCHTGEAKLTKGYRLPAKYIIHTVGPVWRHTDERQAIPVGELEEDRFLGSCYRNSLNLAIQQGIKTIAIPAISTGAYGFPIERATKIAVGVVKIFLATDQIIKQVIFVCHSHAVFAAYNATL